MKKQTPAAVAKSIPDEIREILGPPPILNSESTEIYYATIACFAKDVEPEDTITWFWIKDLADYRVEIARSRRLKQAMLQNAFSQLIDEAISNWRTDLANRSKSLREKADASYVQFAKTTSDESARRETKAAIMEELDKDLARANQNCEEQIKTLRNKSINDLDLASGFYRWLSQNDKLDAHLEVTQKHFMTTLREIERRRFFGTSLRENFKEVIEGEVVNREDAPAVGAVSKALRVRERA